MLIVDYNLSRIDDIRHMSSYARDRYSARTSLIRANPTEADAHICDEVINLDPLRDDFVEMGEKLLGDRRGQFVAGIVFSDDAVHSGAALLHRLGLVVDSADLAAGAFSKYEYRLSEARHADLMVAQRVFIPDFRLVDSPESVYLFAQKHPDGFVIKPTKEGNNRGVIMIGPGDDINAALAEVRPYLAKGVICEQIIPYRREYSYDGLGPLSFVTEKISASGRYPVELAQVVPARLSEVERRTVERAGRQANWLVGQCDGPFHNEIRLSDNGTHGAVVEPNRRPAGMRIWTLADWVYGINFYHRWVDSVFNSDAGLTLPEPSCRAATVMLGVKSDRHFTPDDLDPCASPFEHVAASAVAHFGLVDQDLRIMEFAWISPHRRVLHRTPRDNADFTARVCITLRTDEVDIRALVHFLRAAWLDALDNSYRVLRDAV
jgi:hypothetical protein